MIGEKESPRWILAIVDAKYKTTMQTPERPHGIRREDLYQMTAYLSAYGKPKELLNGGMVYPATQSTPNIIVLQNKSPWHVSGSERRLWFFGLSCDEDGRSGMEFIEHELGFIKGIRDALAACAAVRLAG